MDKPSRIEGIDVNILLVFTREHISLVLNQIQKTGLDVLKLYDDCINEYIKSGEKEPLERWFLNYGQKVINPLMNKQLKRDSNHPTFNNLLNFALKEVLDNSPILKAFNRTRK